MTFDLLALGACSAVGAMSEIRSSPAVTTQLQLQSAPAAAQPSTYHHHIQADHLKNNKIKTAEKTT
eukprot:6482018-Amphidinium_carterae.2